MTIRSIEELPISGKRLFVRVDFNVALGPEVPAGSNSLRTIVDDNRIREALPTIEYARRQEAKIILASHLGRPKGKVDPHLSLLPVAERLSELLATEVLFPDSCIGNGPRKLVREMKPGSVMLLENLRFHPGETANDPEFAAELAELADVYVNDAFGTMHRAHASTAALPKLMKDRGIGYLVRKEVDVLGKLLGDPTRPVVAILGGNKISDKINVIRHLLPRVNTLLIVGGMAYTFLKSQGHDIGNSVCEADRIDVARELLNLAKEKKTKLLVPSDHVMADRFDNAANRKIAPSAEMQPGWMGLDIGPATIELFRKEILDAKTVFWNGPAGVYEMPNFQAGTLALAKALADSHATTIVAGGDSVAAIKALKMQDRMTLLSTGGGATLEFVGGKSLPGLECVES